MNKIKSLILEVQFKGVLFCKFVVIAPFAYKEATKTLVDYNKSHVVTSIKYFEIM